MKKKSILITSISVLVCISVLVISLSILNAATPEENDRTYPTSMSKEEMISKATNMSKKDVKALIFKQVDEHFDVLKSKLGFSTKEQAYGYFLGMATRESTLNAGLETGSQSAHAYGPLQTAETAYANADPSYMPETDVPELYQYDFLPKNFYDAGISVHMGLRKLLHFSNEAFKKYSGVEAMRHTTVAFNTGWIDGSSESWLKDYSDEIAALAGWYIYNGHLYDNEFTWTSDSKVDRTNPWKWYTTAPQVTSNPSSTAIVTPSATSTSTSTSTGVAVNYAVDNDWGTGAVITIKLTNNSTSTINNWTLTWDFPGTQIINNMWNAKYSQSGTTVTVTNGTWNGTIAPKSSSEFGFSITYTGKNDKPTNFTIK